MFKHINAKLKNDTARIEFWVVIGFILVALLFHVFDIIHTNNSETVSETVNATVTNGVQNSVNYVSDPITAVLFNHLIILISYLMLVFYVAPAFENGQEKASNTLFVFAFIAICFVLGIINMYFTALLALKIMVVYFNRNRQNKENSLYYETALLTACWILIIVGLFYVVTPKEVKYFALYNISFAMLVYLYAVHGILPRLWPKRFRFLKYFGLMFLAAIVTTLMMFALTYGESQGSSQMFNQMPQEIINKLKNLSVLGGMDEQMKFMVTVGNFLTQLLAVTPIAWNIYKNRNTKKDEEIKTLKTELGKSDANLNFLKSQINPHFLFNALNTLYGTALQENAERTGEGIQKLGDMMRFMLQENTQDKILLSRDIDFLNSINNPPMVVFTTAYSEHAVKSFELDAVDYLLKPFSLSRFLKACNKAQELYTLRTRPEKSDELTSIFIKDGYEQIKVQLDDILFIEAAGNYTKIHLEADRLLSTRITISDMQLLLPAKKFIRTHRAFIVAFDKISKFDRAQVSIRHYTIPIGAIYSQCLQNLY